MIVKILTPWMCQKAIKFHPIITEHRIPSDKKRRKNGYYLFINTKIQISENALL